MIANVADLDSLATAVVLYPSSVSAWQSLLDFCEENGAAYLPRALIVSMKNWNTSLAQPNDLRIRIDDGERWSSMIPPAFNWHNLPDVNHPDDQESSVVEWAMEFVTKFSIVQTIGGNILIYRSKR